MWNRRESDPMADNLYLAGERVPPGVYRQTGNGRVVYLRCEGRLPASLDGRVACFTCVETTWSEIDRQDRAQAVSSGN